MNLRLILILITSIIASFSFSQNRFGVLAGLNYSEFNGSEINVKQYSPEIGFELGGYYYYMFNSRFGIKPMMTFEDKKIGYDNPDLFRYSTISLHNITLSTLGTFSTKQFILNFGPKISWVANHANAYFLSQNRYKRFNELDVGVLIGISKNLYKNLNLNILYTQGVLSNNKEFLINSEETNAFKMNELTKTLNLSLSYNF